MYSLENYIQHPMINDNGKEYKKQKRMHTYAKLNHFAGEQKLTQG